MKITLFQFEKRNNSTAIPSASLAEVDAHLKEGTSIHEPSFLLNNGNSMNCNYIKWNDAYYWVSDCTIEKNGLYRLDCKEDCLASARDQIAASSQYIARTNYSTYVNSKLIDTLYPTQVGTSYDYAIASDKFNKTGSYILGVVSGDAGITYYQLSVAGMKELCDNLFAEPMDDLWSTIIDGAKASELGFLNVTDYIKDCYWLPVVASWSTINVKLGYWSFVTSGRVVSASEIADLGSILATLQLNFGSNYLNSNNFVKYMLHIPGCGDYPLDADKLIGATSILCNMKYSVRGDVQCQVVSNLNTNAPILYASGNIGVPTVLNSNSYGAANAVNTIGQLGSAVGSVASGNVLLGASQGIAAAQSLMPSCQSYGAQGVGIVGDTAFRLIQYKQTPVTGAPAIFGRPAMTYKQLVTGYFYQIENPQIDFGDLYEKEEISRQMSIGFYLD